MNLFTRKTLSGLIFAMLMIFCMSSITWAQIGDTLPRNQTGASLQEKTKAAVVNRSDLVSVKNTAKGVCLKWNASSNADGYYLYRALPTDVRFKRIKAIGSRTTLSYTDKTVKSGTSYFYTIRAYKKVSGTVSMADYNRNGTGITWLAASRIEKVTDQAGRIHIQWTRSAGSTGYILYRAVNGKDAVAIQVLSGASTLSYTDLDVVKGNSYVYGVAAFKGSFRSVIKKSSKITHRKDVPAPEEGSEKVYRALLVGESIYSPENYNPSDPFNDSSANLYGSRNDVRSMKRMLQGMNYSSVTTRDNITRTQLLSAIRYAFAGADSNDVSLFYFSGHGNSSSYGIYAGALSLINDTNITLRELANVLNAVPGKVIVIMDSCGSGASIHGASGAVGAADGQDVTGSSAERASFDPDAFNEMVIDAFAGVGPKTGSKTGEMATDKFYVLTASEIGEDSIIFDYSVYPGSAFTISVVEGSGFSFSSSGRKASMPADQNKDSKITLKEAYNYTSKQVIKLSDGTQHVQYYPVGSSFVLYYNK